MIELQYKIQFFSPWHCSSGMGGGKDADYCPIKDAENFPFIPGKTIKGLFREAASVLHGKDFTERVFGSPTARDGRTARDGQAVWSNAELQRDIKNAIIAEKLTEKLYAVQNFNKIDENGQTEDKALRRGEYAIPLTLVGSISNLSAEDVNKIQECMGFIKHIGLQRSRGFGRCQISSVAAKEMEPYTFKAVKRQNEYYFKCQFLSSVVLNTTGATEGALGDTLEYVPGSNFLGIAAGSYDSFGEEAFTVFHSGKVSFGNAYPLVNGQMALPCPATWYVAKGKNLENSAILWEPEKRKEVQAELQPKQVRGGYFIPGTPAKLFPKESVFKNFSLKSAYDSEKRKAEDSQMYGYTALNEGTQWAFTVKIDPSVSEKATEKIIASLIGKKQIGRSRSSQYGSVEISLLEKSPLTGIAACNKNKHYIYACSQLSFLDANGKVALLPDLKELGFASDAQFDMEETQIRYHKYSPWNGKRKTRDAERLVVLPGSVFVVKSSTPPDPAVFERGIGLFLSEGFGKVLYNPEFLFCNKLAEMKGGKSSAAVKSKDSLLDYLRQQFLEEENTRKLYESVLAFKEQNSTKFKKIKASQWGVIRAIANGCESYNEMKTVLFERNRESAEVITYIDMIKNNRKSHLKDPGFLYHGVAAEQWQGEPVKLFKDTIENIAEQRGEAWAISFVQLLASEMAKSVRK